MPDNPIDRYRLYLDESGDHVFYDEQSMEEPRHRYLALAGVMFTIEDYISFQSALEILKQRIFPHSPDDPLILHRKEIINQKGPFWRLRDSSTRIAFNNELAALIQQTRFLIFAVVIDKLELKRKYPDPFHPYHMALGFILQRYCGYLNHLNRRGDLMAESRGKTEDNLLRNAYDHIYVHGDMYHASDFFKRALTSKEPKLKRKEANIAGLQLADLLAHPVKQRILIDSGRIRKTNDNFGEELCILVEDKYNRHLYTGEVEGYGKVLFPK